MGLIERNDLSLEYDWSTKPGNSPIDQDDNRSTVFDNQRGEDVLNLLNDYAEKRELKNKNEVLKAENLLRKELPKDLNTQEDSFDWLWSKMGHDQRHS